MSTGPHDRLISAVADELATIGHRLEELGCALGSESILIARHVGRLQELDLLAQTQHELAAVLRMLSIGRRADAIAGVRLEGLAARLG